MKLTNRYWTNENNNKWDSFYYSEEQAIKMSKTLTNCNNCINCKNCRDCTDCRDCRDCEDCHSCEDCNHLYNAENFKHQPIILSTNRIGSRNDITYFYKYDNTIYVKCGCFYGQLDKFEKAVEETHGNNEFGIVYKEWISKAKKIFIEEKIYE